MNAGFASFFAKASVFAKASPDTSQDKTPDSAKKLRASSLRQEEAMAWHAR
ncbi:MAG: hypothetical protein PHR77_09830 [Kiritimatiellae bacterium]|nr:hypothetical protein [Kiritimatiellia bacterium]MDD5522596.1 hypothetical protein [Kiritimatiellia bacterium]